MGAEEEDPWKPYKVEVVVTDPVSFSSPYRSIHTSYCIKINTNHPAFSLPCSEVRRRFSEFRWLRSVLQRHHPEREPPVLPSGGMLVWNRFTAEFIECRRGNLETFINKVIARPVYLGERAVHLFLQTALHTQEIELNLSGKRDDVIVPRSEDCDTSPQENESNRACDTSYAEDALTLLADGECCSYENTNVEHLIHAGIEEKVADGTPWYTSSKQHVPEEGSPVMFINESVE